MNDFPPTPGFILQGRYVCAFVALGFLGVFAACGDDGRTPLLSDDDMSDGVFVQPSELSEHQKAILDVHNAYRETSVRPAPAPALPLMTWDAELARVSQEYADRCIWGHNSERTAQYRGDGYVGENLSATSGQTSAIDPEGLSRLVKLWTSEDVDYNYDSNTCAAGKVCGHYTQVVWRETTRVGCGWARCASLQNIPDWSAPLILVCNYAPGGNYVGQRPY